MRGTGVDFEDCLMLVKARHEHIDIGLLVSHFRELASYDIAEDHIAGNIDRFIELLCEEKLYE